MKPGAIIILGLLATVVFGSSQTTESKYGGKASVAGLGTIAFPPGEWVLECQRIQAPTNALHLPDYFVFKRVGDRFERLTFLRYLPTTKPRPLAHLLDTVGETMGNGMPWQERKKYSLGGEIVPMRMEPSSPSLTERTIAFSFIHVLPSPAPSWLCHSFLFLQGNSAFVIAHASPSVTNPETVREVQSRSQFLSDAEPVRDDE